MNHKTGMQSRLMKVLLIACLLFAGHVHAEQYFFDAQDEYLMGLTQDRQLMEKHKIFETEKLHTIHTIAEKLTRVSDKRRAINYSFFLVEKSPIGSCSIAGGFVYIDTADLELIGDNDDELAFVIAHEMAHIDHRDSANNIELETAFREKDTPYKKSYDIKLKNLVYNRQQEYSADAYATLYIYKCGYAPDAGIRIMKKFKANFGEFRPGMELFKEHPSFSHRIENMEGYIQKIRFIENKFQEGVNALKYKEFDTAIVHFSEYQTMFFDSREVYNNLGWAYFCNGMKNSTIQGEWHYGEGIDPVVKKPEEYLAMRGAEKKNEGHIDRISFENAVSCYKKARSIDREYELPLNNLAILCVQLGNEAEALAMLDELKRHHPLYHAQFNTFGIISARKNDFTQAIQYFKQALELSPDYAPSLFNTALCHERAGNIDSAGKFYKEFLDKDTDPKNEWHAIAREKLKK